MIEKLIKKEIENFIENYNGETNEIFFDFDFLEIDEADDIYQQIDDLASFIDPDICSVVGIFEAKKKAVFVINSQLLSNTLQLRKQEMQKEIEMQNAEYYSMKAVNFNGI